MSKKKLIHVSRYVLSCNWVMIDRSWKELKVWNGKMYRRTTVSELLQPKREGRRKVGKRKGKVIGQTRDGKEIYDRKNRSE